MYLSVYFTCFVCALYVLYVYFVCTFVGILWILHVIKRIQNKQPEFIPFGTQKKKVLAIVRFICQIYCTISLFPIGNNTKFIFESDKRNGYLDTNKYKQGIKLFYIIAALVTANIILGLLNMCLALKFVLCRNEKVFNKKKYSMIE